MPDMVNTPPHYISDSGIETIDVIKAFTKDLDPFEAYCTGNVIKYICRWKHKNGIEDLKKARWYIDRILIEHEAQLPPYTAEEMYEIFKDLHPEKFEQEENYFQKDVNMGRIKSWLTIE